MRKYQKVAFEAISHATVVEYLPHRPKAKGLSPTGATGTCSKKLQKMILRPSTAAQWYNTCLVFLMPGVRAQLMPLSPG
jgi:hypothetical protein